MNTNEKPDLPTEILAMFAKREAEAEQVRNQLTVGTLLDSISEDRPASPNELLRVAEVGKTLLYAALAHRDATHDVLEEARTLRGPLVDAALRECGVRDPL